MLTTGNAIASRRDKLDELYGNRDKIRSAYRTKIREQCRTSINRHERRFLQMAEAGFCVSSLLSNGCPHSLANALVRGIHPDERV